MNDLVLPGGAERDSEETCFFRYEREDDSVYYLTDRSGRRVTIEKNRSTSNPPPEKNTSIYSWPHRILLAAFLGLAPAGLGTLVLAPLALLWAGAESLIRQPGRTDRIRLIFVVLIAVALLAVAFPLSRLYPFKVPFY
jgi:hypothetical protein